MLWMAVLLMEGVSVAPSCYWITNHYFFPKQLQVLTFWHYRILKAHFVYLLPQS